MYIKELIKRLKQNEIDLSLSGNDLEVNFDGEELSEEVISEIRKHKAEIIAFLKQMNSAIEGHHEIEIAPKQDYYPLSSSQLRLWILSQFEEGNVAYNISAIKTFEGNFDIPAFENAFKQLIERHEILRTVFKENDNNEVKQYVLNTSELNFLITQQDLHNLSDKENKIQDIVRKELTKPFDLEKGPLLRATLLQTDVGKWIFTYSMHHIISDGWSMRIMLNELLELYNANLKHEENTLIPLRIQYKEYAVWQQQQLKDKDNNAHREYWLNQFHGQLPVLDMPGYTTRPVIKTFNGSKSGTIIPKETYVKLKTFCFDQGVTTYMFLLASINSLLYRYCGQTDIIIGSPIAGRDHPDLENQIGFYVNTLALRTIFDADRSFLELLEQVKQNTIKAYEHQSYPFDELVEELKLKRDLSRNALFDVMLVLQNHQIALSSELKDLGEVTVSNYEGKEDVISKFDFTFDFQEDDATLSASIEYNTDIYTKTMAEQMLMHLKQIINTILDNPEEIVSRLNYLKPDEQISITEELNDTKINYPEPKTVIDLFEEQVLRTPLNNALVFEGKKITYQALNKKVNSFARHIQTVGKINKGDYVGVMVDRSEFSVIAMIGIMKLGAVYVPVDKNLPENRIVHMLSACSAKAVITDFDCQLPIEQKQSKEFVIIEKATFIEDENNDNLNVSIPGPSSSYIIYTSGSTGQPKGVEQTHIMLYNLINWEINGLKMAPAQKHLQFSSFSFDSSLNDVFFELATGGEIYLLNETLRKDFVSLKNYLIDEKIETVSMPYAALKVMFSEIGINEFDGHFINEIISTGEQLYVTGGLRAFLQKYPHVKLLNLYGPSETHVVTGSSFCFADGDMPFKTSIGKPVYNTQIYILDKHMQVVPLETEGEIYIGGLNLAIGYNGRQDLTDEKFIDNPFIPAEKIYRSGDIGKWLSNGNIEYIRRKDNQLKVNGYRIELEEIEIALQNHDLIKEAVVLAKENKEGEKVLVAYVVGDESLGSGVLRSYLQNSLPAYMIPSYFMQLTQMPLTPNGKVDKNELLLLKQAEVATGVEYIAPGNETEKQLHTIWEELLDLKKISTIDNFFDLGGNSLSATRMLSRIRKEFSVNISILELFNNPTIAYLSKEIIRRQWATGQMNTSEEETISLTI